MTTGQKHRHHKIFGRFTRWQGIVPAGFEVDFLGAKHRTAYFTMMKPHPSDSYEIPTFPEFNEEYFEWVDLLESVAWASGRFVMFELGAGFGRWTTRGAVAAKHAGLPYTLIAVEAEPTRFKWITQNLQDNEIDLKDCRLFEAAVADSDGKVGFQVADPASGYGESIGGNMEVNAISLNTLLFPMNYVDLIDLDVQGAELGVLAAATVPLSQKVKRVHVETHSEQLHRSILQLFRGLGWKPHFLFAYDTADTTPWGRINFQGGIQSWLNPRLHTPAELRQVRFVGNSLTWRTITACRNLLDRTAPPDTLRRKVFNATLSGIGSKYRRDNEDIGRRGR